MSTISMIRIEQTAPGCPVCSFQHLCLVRGLVQGKCVVLETLTQTRQKLPTAHKALYWEGDKFQNIYAVRSGCLKTYTVDDGGREHIRGFHLPGDLIGLDSISVSHYPSSAIAVVPSEVCAIPYAALSRAATDAPVLQRGLMGALSKDLRISLALSGDYTAEQRLAAFLLHMYQRMKQREMVSGNSVWLLMPRRDIAAYLRLAIETVSRVLGRFEREDWLEVRARDLRLLDMPALWHLAEPVGICEAPELSRPLRQPALRHSGYAQAAFA